MKLFEELAEALNVPTLVCETVVNAVRFAMTQGYGPKDFTAYTQIVEAQSGVQIRA